MKHIKKIGALVLAIAMILSLSSVAFAADTAGDVYTDDSKTVVNGTNIPINKSIVFFNQNGSSVYEPNITYTYTVATVTVNNGATVTDDGDLNSPSNDPVTVRVNSGVADGVTGTTISFSATNQAVTNVIATGTEVEKIGNLTVDLTKFDHAGIYRYKVTESQNPPDVTTVGLEARDASYSNERYLDVYIANGTTAGTLVLSGAVFFKTDSKDTSSPVNNATDAITTTTEKTTGFEPGTPAGTSGSTIDYTNDKTVDRYTTYDIEVKKSITGNLADKTHQFPFYVNITNTISGAKYTYTDVTGSSVADPISGTSIAKGADDKTNTTLKLKDGESIKFVGVPSNQTSPLSIDVKEWNDTVDKYTASVELTSGTAPAVTGAAMDANSATPAVIGTFDIKANDAANQKMTVTNNLAEISPTGYVVRIAPYVLMLAGGIALLVVTRRRREDAQAA